MADVEYVIELDADGAVLGLKKLADAEKQANDSAKTVEQSTKRMQLSFTELNQGLELAKKGFALVSGAISSLGDAVRQGQNVNDLASAFENLTQKAGVAGDVLLNQLNEATGRTITNVDLMATANRALAAGLDPEIFDEVAEAARAYADTVGGDAKAELDSFLESLAKGDDRALKTRGILIDNEAAYRDYAATIGTTADKLSELGKAEAIKAAATEALRNKTAELGQATVDTADALDRIAKEYTDQKNEVFASIAANEDLKRAFEDVANAIQQIDTEQLSQNLATLISMFSQLASKAIPWATQKLDEFVRGLQVLGEVDFSRLLGNFGELQRAQEKVWERENNASIMEGVAAIEKAGEVATAASASFNAFSEGMVVTAKDVEALEEQLSDLPETIHGTEKNQSIYRETLEDTRRTIQNLIKLVPEQVQGNIRVKAGVIDLTKGQDEAKKKSDELKKAITELADITAKAAGFDRFPKLTQQIRDAFSDRSTQSAEQFDAALRSIGEDALKAGVPLEEFKRKLQETQAIAEGAAAAVQKVFSGYGKQVTDIGNGPSDSGMLGGYLDGALGIDLSGAIDPEQLKQAIGAQIGQSLSSLAGALQDGQIAAGEFQQVGAAVGTLIGTAIGAYYGGPSGAAQGGAAGAGIGSAIGGIVEMIAGAFDSDTAGTKAREAADRYFADLFDANRLSIIVDGEIRRIKDLVFQGMTEFGGQVNMADGTFDDFLAGLEPAAMSAFNGVGLAFANLLGVSEDISGQIGAVIANNIGGELNNLQLFIEDTGKSFEELSAGIVDSFEDGMLTIAEAQSALEGLQLVMTDGIPGAAGAVDEAFQNMMAALKDGGKGSRALLDAIQDIAFEAEELKVQTFPELADVLVNTFQMSAQEVQAFFAALKAAGIDTLQELQDASAETLIAIAANVEQAMAGETPTHTPVSDPTAEPEEPASSGGGRSGGGSRGPETKTRTVFIVPQIERSAIRGVQDAINELVKLGEIGADKFSKAFFEDFSGDINMLQASVAHLTGGFKSMQDQAVASFLAGKTSAEEAAKAIQDAGQGIPGFTGAIDKAFQNFQKYGTKGGAFTLDALRDIAAEAQELGLTTVDGLGEVLKLKGIPADQIALLLQEVKEKGIVQLDALKNIGAETGIEIVAGLSAAGFQFQETASDISRLLDQMDKLKRGQEVNLKINVSTGKVDENSRKILEALGVRVRDVLPKNKSRDYVEDNRRGIDR